MIRPATPADLPRLYELVLEMHARSEYARRGIGVDEASARSILKDGVYRNGRTNNGGTLLNVVEFRGEVEGFMLGLLQRVYTIGDRLEAQDYWLFTTKRCPRVGWGKLVDAYLAWALNNPKVADVRASWTDAAGVDGEKLGRIYEKKGFRRCGAIYTRESK
jgi:hypothetical protein